LKSLTTCTGHSLDEDQDSRQKVCTGKQTPVIYVENIGLYSGLDKMIAAAVTNSVTDHWMAMCP
jgi:hypothetical protein